jgi:hypothetical protein
MVNNKIIKIIKIIAMLRAGALGEEMPGEDRDISGIEVAADAQEVCKCKIYFPSA